jgi:hypothetical protein
MAGEQRGAAHAPRRIEHPQSTPTTPDWPPLDRSLLGESRAAPPPFPLPLLPGRWRDWVEASSLVFGSADYLAQCLLGGVAGVCGAGMRINVAPHRYEPLLLWQALVGGPSSGKSAAFGRVHASAGLSPSAWLQASGIRNARCLRPLGSEAAGK